MVKYGAKPVRMLSCGLQVQADVRTIRSRNFASRHSLRFPRVQRIRWDKAPTQIQTDAELWHIIESNKGAIVGAHCSKTSGPTCCCLSASACWQQWHADMWDGGHACLKPQRVHAAPGLTVHVVVP
jgi:hypothetical protein